MKKLAIFVISLLSTGSFAVAQTSGTVGDVDPNGVSNNQCVSLTNNLRLGMRDANTNNEVSLLQDFLNPNYLASEPTGYFGKGTLAAVKSFQSENGFISSGYVGPMTRAKIKELSCFNTNTTGTPPFSVNKSTTNPLTVSVEYFLGSPCSSYVLDWGDGTNSNYTVPSGVFCGQVMESYTKEHTYSKAGTYTVKFQTGAYPQQSVSVTVGGSTCPTPGTAPVCPGTSTQVPFNSQTCSWNWSVCSPSSSQPIKVVYPAGGEQIQMNSGKDVDFRIYWTDNIGTGNAYVYLHYPDGGMCYLGSVLSAKGNFGVTPSNYNCPNIPRMITPGQYTVLIKTDGSYSAESATFTLVSNASLACTRDLDCPVGNTCVLATGRCVQPAPTQSVRILSPNGGEVFEQGYMSGNTNSAIKNKITWSSTQPTTIALVRSTYQVTDELGIIGWITPTPSTQSAMVWAAQIICDAGGLSCQSVAPGQYKLLAVSKSSNGNYCITSNVEKCNVDVSDAPFTIAPQTTNPQLLPTIATNPDFKDQTVSPNTVHVKIASFLLSSGQTETSLNSVNVGFGAFYQTNLANLSNLTVTDSNGSPLSVPVGNPAVNNTFTFSTITIPAYKQKILDVYADIGSSEGYLQPGMTIVGGNGAMSAVTTIRRPGGITATLSPSSPASQLVVGGTNFAIATYRVRVDSGSASVNYLKFTTTGTDAISSVSVKGIYAPVINGVATISGLNIPVTSTEGDIPVTVTFNGFQNSTIGGTLTGPVSGVSLTLSQVNASAAGSSLVNTTPVSSNQMTLVASKPTVVLSGGGTGKIDQQTKLADVTITADAGGRIALDSIPVNFAVTGLTNAMVTGVKLMDSGGFTVGGAALSSNGLSTMFNFTNGGYEISAGMSKTFGIYGTATGIPMSGIEPKVITMLTPSSSFKWKDVFGGNASYTGERFLNYPTNSSVTILSAPTQNTVPTITGITPAQGTTGSSIRIDGTNLSGVTTIEFLNSSNQFVASLASPSIVSVSSNYVYFTIPASFAANVSAGTYQVRVVSNTCAGGCNSNTIPFALTSSPVATGWTLTVSKSGTGSGTITSSPAGINCGSVCSAQLTGYVTLTETPASGSTFAGWGGAGYFCGTQTTCTVGMTQAWSVTATFNAVSLRAPTIDVMGASPAQVSSTETTTLSWKTSNTTSCTLDGVTAPVTGAKIVNGGSYTLACTGPGGTVSQTIDIPVYVVDPIIPTPVRVCPDGTIVHGDCPLPTKPTMVVNAKKPIGWFDSVSSGPVGTCGAAVGWSFDEDKPTEQIQVHLYVDGPAGATTPDAGTAGPTVAGYNTGVTTDSRPDVNSYYSISGIHGFRYNIPNLTAGTHKVYAYGININNAGQVDGENIGISGSPITITCTPLARGAQAETSQFQVLASSVKQLEQVYTLATGGAGTVALSAPVALSSVTEEIMNFTGLKKGANEVRVSRLKEILRTISPSVSIGCANLSTSNTLYGPTTEECVKVFQNLNELEPTGTVNEATNKALNRVLAR